MSGGRLPAVPRVHLVLGRRRGPGRLALHRHGLWTLGQLDVALAAIVRRVRDLGLTDRPALPRLSPGAWAADTSRLTANAERSLANEAGGPVAQLLPVPQDGGDGGRGRHGPA